MNIKPMTIAQSLNKAYLKQDISITDLIFIINQVANII